MRSCKGNCGFIYFVKARKTNKAWVAKDALLRQTQLLSPEATCAQKQAACVHHAEPPGKAPVQGWVTRVAPPCTVIGVAHSWGKVWDTSRPQISPVPLFGAHTHTGMSALWHAQATGKMQSMQSTVTNSTGHKTSDSDLIFLEPVAELISTNQHQQQVKPYRLGGSSNNPKRALNEVVAHKQSCISAALDLMRKSWKLLGTCYYQRELNVSAPLRNWLPSKYPNPHR